MRQEEYLVHISLWNKFFEPRKRKNQIMEENLAIIIIPTFVVMFMSVTCGMEDGWLLFFLCKLLIPSDFFLTVYITMIWHFADTGC